MLFLLLSVIALAGILLLQRLTSEKLPEPQKSFLATNEIRKVTNNTHLTRNQRKTMNSENACIISNRSSENQSVVPLKEARLVGEDKISELGLSSPFDDSEIAMVTAKAQAVQVYREQDKIMATWPVYLDVREELHKELLAELDLDELSSDELIDIASKLRNKFWQAGGNLSTVSYKNGYKARILFELAHNKDPGNMALIDELIETIQSIEPAWKYKRNSNKKLANSTYQTILPELRSAQFEEIKKEVEQGRALTWEDFVRAYELALLWGRADESKSAQEVVTWLIPEAEDAGYEVYIEQLKKLENKLRENSVLEFNVYVCDNSSIFEEIKYGRRFPSFQGPNIQKRLVLPVHESLDKPIWYRDPFRKR